MNDDQPTGRGLQAAMQIEAMWKATLGGNRQIMTALAIDKAYAEGVEDGKKLSQFVADYGADQ